MNIGAPQAIYLACSGIVMISYLHQGSRELTIKINAFERIGRSFFMIGFLYWGGFFS